MINKHIVHHHHRVGSREQRVVRKNFLTEEALILSAINSALVNIVAKDAIHSVHQQDTPLLKVFNRPV